METPTRLCIVRHGETDWNVEKRVQGHHDIPLNATGLGQAQATAEALSELTFSAAYSSDLRRSWQTAEIVAGRLGIPLRARPGLRERHYGLLEGLTIEELSKTHPVAHARYRARNPDFNFGTGESLRAFAARVVGSVEDLIACHPGGTLLLVTHGGVLDVILRRATGRSLDAPRDYPLPNAGINWFEHQHDSWQLVSWAQGSHLDPSGGSGVEHWE